jgi:hypothetical protein
LLAAGAQHDQPAPAPIDPPCPFDAPASLAVGATCSPPSAGDPASPHDTSVDPRLESVVGIVPSGQHQLSCSMFVTRPATHAV